MVLSKANTGERWQEAEVKLKPWRTVRGGGPETGRTGVEGRCRGCGGLGKEGKGRGLQKLPWTKGWLSRTSAVGRRFSCTNTCRRKSLQASVTPSGSMGFVGWVAILKMAAMASYSAHGGFWVSISTTVQATLLRRKDPAAALSESKSETDNRDSFQFNSFHSSGLLQCFMIAFL